MSLRSDLAALLKLRDFRRLFFTRVTSQLSDGVFQVAIAGHAFFSPEKRTTAGEIAAAFAVLLLPYSLVGPFTGVLLDRWRRREVLVWCNVLRAVLVTATASIVVTRLPNALFYTACLVVLSVNRFVLAGLSASLPRVVPGDRLVLANAVSPTAGTVAATAGAGAAVVVHLFVAPGDWATALVMLTSAVVYLAAAAVAATMPGPLLGPDPGQLVPGLREALSGVARGLAAGVAHVWRRREPAYALGAVAAMRFCFGVVTVMTVLLCRAYFNDPSDTNAGLSSLGTTVVVSGAGFFVAAVLTPGAVRRSGVTAWIAGCAVAGAAGQAAFGLPFHYTPLLVGAFVLGVVSQGAKIGVDTVVQTTVDDEYRGRVFSGYDVLFNVAFVGAAAAAAALLPADGHSPGVLLGTAAGYALTGLGYAALAGRTVPRAGNEGQPP